MHPRAFHTCQFPEQTSESWAMRKATLPHTRSHPAKHMAPAEFGEENFHSASFQQTLHHGTTAPCRHFPPVCPRQPRAGSRLSTQLPTCPPGAAAPHLASSPCPRVPGGCHRRLLPPCSGHGKAPSQPGQGRAEGSSTGGR